MRIILLLLLLANLAACSDAFKPKHHLPLKNRRMPVENCNLIKQQKQEAEEQQVDSVIKEYSFNENFDEQPMSDISLTEVAPNYMEPSDIDTQVGMHDEPDLALDKVQEVKISESFSEPQKKSYSKLTTVPKKKVSTNSHKKILANKKQEISTLEQNAKKPSKAKTKITATTLARKPVQAAIARPNKEEIAAKIKQLQSNAVKENVVAKDRATPNAVETNTAAALPKVSNQAPTVSTIPVPVSAPTTPTTPQNAPIEPSMPSIPTMTGPSAPPPTLPAIPNNPTPAPSKKIKINSDQSVEVYDNNPVPPPAPPPELPQK